MSMTDAVCLMADQDYLIIEDSSNVCMQGGIVGVTKDLYCGMFLNTFDGSVVDTTICGKRSFNFFKNLACVTFPRFKIAPLHSRSTFVLTLEQGCKEEVRFLIYFL